MTGQARFHPPLTDGGTAPEVTSLHITVAGCSVGGGGVAPTSGHGSLAVTLPTASCAVLTARSKVAVAVALTWSPAKAGVSEVRFPALAPLPKGSSGLSLRGRGTRATGSYAGRDAGASSSARLLWSLSSRQIADHCGAGSGLRVLEIPGGAVTLR